ncbi:hypothetical protein F2Q69_00057557 [Brassica cretica]|uniref:Uncharacterized protein n=1 Tax=Brassica cretica TaxID=69181 RepID=A0A8S9MPG4_BRACR|nr:hypothetical protein F2Q69_00057557 [Brassica cretica]
MAEESSAPKISQHCPWTVSGMRGSSKKPEIRPQQFSNDSEVRSINQNYCKF